MTNELKFIVKEDNKVYLLREVPEKPKHWAGDTLNYNKAALQFYNKALQKAKDNVVLVSNQDFVCERIKEQANMPVIIECAIYTLTGFKSKIEKICKKGSCMMGDGCYAEGLSFERCSAVEMAVISPIGLEEECPFSEMSKNKIDDENQTLKNMDDYFDNASKEEIDNINSLVKTKESDYKYSQKCDVDKHCSCNCEETCIQYNVARNSTDMTFLKARKIAEEKTYKYKLYVKTEEQMFTKKEMWDLILLYNKSLPSFGTKHTVDDLKDWFDQNVK